MNIKHELVATLLITDIKHQPDRVWLTFDVKQQPDAVLIVFHTSQNDKAQSKKCQNCIPFLESTYPEMQRKTYN